MMETNLIAATKERTWTMMMAPNLRTRGGLQKQHLLLIWSMRPQRRSASSQPSVFQLMSR